MVLLGPAAGVDVGAALLVDWPLLEDALDEDEGEDAVVFESEPHPESASPRAIRATAVPPAVLCNLMRSPVGRSCRAQVGKLKVHANWRAPSESDAAI